MSAVAALVVDALQPAARVFGVLLFGSAAIGKLRHGTEFVGIVANYRLLPESLAAPAAHLIVVAELLVAAMLAAGLWPAAAGAAALVLLALFTGAIALALARGDRAIDCGCFRSALRQRLSPLLLARNGVLALTLVPLLLPARPPASALQWLDAIGAGITLFLLYVVAGMLMSLRDAAAALNERYA